MADDGTLVSQQGNADGVLDAGAARGATFARVLAYMGSYPNDDRYVQAAQTAASRGFGLDVVLALPWAEAQMGVTPPQFAAWAAHLAARLAAVGAPLRLSLLNEPDLLLAASDLCDPTTAQRVVREAGYVPTAKRVRITVRRSRIARRIVRRHGRRHVIRRKLVWKSHRWKTVKRMMPTEHSTTNSTVSVAQGCLSVQRARRAAAFLAAGIPAVRAAAPGIPVGAGETSATTGVGIFMREVARVGIPPVDRWAHHPYPRIVDGHESSSPPAQYWSDRIGDYVQLVHELFGPTLPVDVTEFGVKHILVADPQVRASIWRSAYARACAAHVRSIVAYQWTPTPAGQGRSWDTSIMGSGLTDTPESQQLPALRC